ncbi:hypothetical protein BV898_11537 [Hypsibius exemplaris]|uniref:Uncharacterized protein n=1 Tax=Hypsibius exemplaris TaxID=2072580 RepID=A0A1W0WGJ4_HYPEX|nr:hypothetical protein BV898_11537 [Hypsibius exemplaris]
MQWRANTRGLRRKTSGNDMTCGGRGLDVWMTRGFLKNTSCCCVYVDLETNGAWYNMVCLFPYRTCGIAVAAIIPDESDYSAIPEYAGFFKFFISSMYGSML